MKFQDISRFSDTQKYLPLLNAAMDADLIVFSLVFAGYIQQKSLKKWYHELGLSAVLADILSIVIGITIATFFYPFFFSTFHVLYLAGLAVLVQFTHDILFALFIRSFPRGKSQIIDIFQDYAKEFGPQILLADASMMVFTVIFGSLYASLGQNMNIVFSLIHAYLIPYFLYST
jgi:uncharacterized protein YacL